MHGMTMDLGVATLAYGFAAGVMIALGLVFAMIAIRRRRFDAIHITFCCAGVVMGAGAAITVRLHSSQTVSEYVTYFKVFGLVSLLTTIAIVSLVAVWTESIPRILLIAQAVASLLIGILALALPEGLLAAEITGLREVSLFGETFVVHDAGTSPWRPALDAYLALSIGLIVVGLVRGRHRARAEVLTLSIGLTVMVLVALYDSLVDEGVVSTPYLFPFGSLALVFLGSWWLASEAADHERLLREHAAELESTVAERTSELVEANTRLKHEFARQVETMEQLTSLTEHFERVNAFVLDTGGHDELFTMMQAALGDLALLVGASQVSLEIEPSEQSVTGAVIRWPPEEAARPEPVGVPGHVTVEQLTASGRSFGKLIVHSSGQPLDAEQVRFIELTTDHLAGFLQRVELAEQIARTAVADERERLARELHDSVTQKLYAASFLSDALLQQIGADGQSPEATVRRLRQVLLSSLAELRALMYEIHPPALDTTGLGELLEQLGQGYRVDPDLDFDVSIESQTALPTNAKIGLYRIAQEAVSNAVRHAGSTAVTIGLASVRGGVELVVSDDGCGFDVARQRPGHGLQHMHDRAEAIGAFFELDSSPSRGTAVRVVWLPSSDTLAAHPNGADHAGSSVS